ncbi:MAG: hypothetical protein H6625_09470 [Bdellovibrionaceae bacterium]|nr:hypothetical protein [Pseudobdellovibrionaceae bacterium]
MRFTLFTFTLLLGSSCFSDEFIEKSFGTAKNKNGDIVYLEKHISHYINGKLKALRAEYYKTDGKFFGSIQSDFSKSSNLPDYVFTDKRHNRMDSLKWNEKKVIASAKESKTAKKIQKEFAVSNNTVAGQGLHNYILSKLENYIKQNDLEEIIDFLIPMNQKTYNFRIRPINNNEIDRTITLRIEADSWFFRLISPHIDVKYDIDNRRLLEYKGPSNLLNDEGEKINVIIAYTYDRKKGT